MASKENQEMHGNIASMNVKSDVTSLKSPVSLFSSYKSTEKNSFKESEMQVSVEPFEIFTGITNDSPEIVLLTNFIPVYDDSGVLNKAGQVFQAKQDSLLVSANSSIESIINSNVYSQIVDKVVSNRQELENFCQYFGQDIDSLLRKFYVIRKKLDCRSPINEQDLSLIGINSNSFSSLSSIEEILSENDSSIISKWTATKAWIQVVLELKESFQSGLSVLLSDSLSTQNKNDAYYESPYNIVTPKSAFIKKFGFNANRITVPDFFSLSTSDNIKFTVQDLKILFNLKSSFNIFNRSVFSDISRIDESISRLSHVICKEYVFSTRMDSKVLTDYGYSLDTNNGNVKIWDYLFGRSGSDITDISTSPLGDGKSLVSLSQYIETDGTEVLSFEDNYIKDNVGTKRPNAVLTPGTYYYVESSINSSINNFDLIRIDSYVLRLKSAIAMLEMLKNNLAFKNDINSYVTVSQKVTKKSELTGPSNDSFLSNKLKGSTKFRGVNSESLQQKTNSSSRGINSQGKSTDVKDVLSNPILLLREIEKEILGDSYLLVRSPSPMSWTTSKKPFEEIKDISPLIISAAIEDSELMSLLFMHLSAGISGKNLQSQSQTGITTNTNKHEISTKIIERLKEITSYSATNFFTLNEQSDKRLFNYYQIEECLVSENSQVRQTLFNIENFLNKLIKYFDALEINESDFEKFFISNPLNPANQSFLRRQRADEVVVPQVVDKRTTYSSIQKTTYIAAIFQLCCLMVHAANSERITARTNVGYGDEYVVNAVKKPALRNENEKAKVQQVQKNSFPFSYDSIMVECEKSLSTYNKTLLGHVNRVYGFIFSLYKELENFSLSLKNKGSKYSDFIETLGIYISDPSLRRLLMTEEQMLLIRGKFYDVTLRSNLSYDSEIKKTIPYFLNLKDNQNVDHFLPIEDVHLVSWNLLLKDYLNSFGFRESEGFNKKIISVGIPQKLHRFLQKDASKIDGSGPARKNKLIKIHIFKVDNLRPDVVYRPLTYLFDLDRFPTRVLKNYIDSGFSLTKSSVLDLSKIPILKSSFGSDITSINSFTLFTDQKSSFDDYQFLNSEEKDELIRNHSMNFLVEEYLNYFSGVSFDEQKYFRYDAIKKIIDTEFLKFVNQIENTQIQSFNSPSIENYFSGETFLTNIESLKRSLIIPKKFDRTFNIIFDPDDFFINEDLTEKATLKKYELDDDEETFKTNVGDITFDTYYVAVESYDEKDTLK